MNESDCSRRKGSLFQKIASRNYDLAASFAKVNWKSCIEAARFSIPTTRQPGSTPHSFSASMSGSNLTVKADNSVAWEGDLGPVALEFDGPVGLRSDNAHVVFDFLVSR